jgi:RimJ/RimL family protein N-acetyltransferase
MPRPMRPVTLQGTRIRLRPWRPEDLDPLFAINGDPDSMRHFPSVMTRAESDAWAERLQTHFEQHGWGFWVVEETGGAPFLGVVGLMRIPWEAPFTPAVEIGWRIHPAHRRRGIAEDAARLARLGMAAAGEFDHPRLPEGHPLRRHLLYRVTAPPGSPGRGA